MSKQTINIGASPNDGTGTPLRTSFDYTNQNFTELYTALGGGVGLPGATTQVIFNDGGTNLAGDAGLVYNKTTDTLTAGNATITGAATVGTTLGVTSDLTVGTSPFALKIFPATNRVIINQAAPVFGSPLEISALSNGDAFSLFGRASDNISTISFRANGAITNKASIQGGDSGFDFITGATIKQTINSTTGDVTVSLGNLVMGTSGKGIDFSATANSSGTMTSELLNDYEEGTWTIGLTFGGGNTGLTTALNTGRYTKIGRQVTVCGRLELSNKGSSTGAAVITGLPFSIANANEAAQAASFRCNGLSYTGAFQGYGTVGSTTIPLEQISEAGSLTDLTNSNFVNGTSIQISLTYTV